MNRIPKTYLWTVVIILLAAAVWLGIDIFEKQHGRYPNAVTHEIERKFQLPENVDIRVVAKEPDIINPMTMCVDEHGSIYVSESSTYRYGLAGAPSKKVLNPIKRIDIDAAGNAKQVTLVAEGFANPVMGIDVFENKFYATCLNELFVMDINPDGKLSNRRVLVRDSAEPWNPFGMYRVVVGPDAKLWLAIADHPGSKPVTLTGTDGRLVRLRGQSGGFVRCNLDGSGLEMIVQGFRAPFGFDFDPWGHLWAISNGEGSPNIYVNVIPGMDYGYHSRNVSYAWLAGKSMLAPPVREMGPGANTVALHYYNSMLPEQYWGNILMANWGSHGANPTNRMIKLFVPADIRNSEAAGPMQQSLMESPDPFLTSSDSMFRPVSMTAAPDGGLYLADWHGHDDESDSTGRIFKISYVGGQSNNEEVPSDDDIRKMEPGQLAALLGHRNKFVRENATRALVTAGSTAMNSMAEILKNGSAFAAANAIWTLVRMNSVGSVKTMQLALKHSDPRVRALALRQLRQAAGQTIGGGPFVGTNTISMKSAIKPVLREIDLAVIAESLANDFDAEVRMEASLALPSSTQKSERLLAALPIAADPRIRYQIAFELGRYGDFGQLEKLYTSPLAELRRVAMIAAQTARLEGTPLAASTATWNLNVNEGDAGEELVLQISTGKTAPSTPADRLLALDWLANNRATAAPRIATFLLNAVQDHDYLVQAAALRAIRSSRVHGADFRNAVRSIANKNQGHPIGSLQLEALYTLGSFPGNDGVEDWIQMLKDSTDDVVIAALRSLRQHQHSATFMELLWPAGQIAAQRSPELAEEVYYTFRFSGFEPGRLQTLVPPRSRPANKERLADLILSQLKNASTQRGKWSFDVTCSACHSVRAGAVEEHFGPNLSSIGAASQPQYLIESILQPSKVLKTGFQMETIMTGDGQVYSGQIETNDQQITVKRFGSPPVNVPMKNVNRRITSHVSPMPAGLDDACTIKELADLTAYLLTLKEEN